MFALSVPGVQRLFRSDSGEFPCTLCIDGCGARRELPDGVAGARTPVIAIGILRAIGPVMVVLAIEREEPCTDWPKLSMKAQVAELRAVLGRGHER